jgi:hypothetical protein
MPVDSKPVSTLRGANGFLHTTVSTRSSFVEIYTDFAK